MGQNELVEAINIALDARDSLDKEKHSLHHKWIEHQIEDDKEAKKRWQERKEKAIGWIIIMGLSGIGTAVYNFWFKQGGH